MNYASMKIKKRSAKNQDLLAFHIQAFVNIACKDGHRQIFLRRYFYTIFVFFSQNFTLFTQHFKYFCTTFFDFLHQILNYFTPQFLLFYNKF